MRFDANSLKVAPIREEQEYGGMRVQIIAQVTAAQVRLQIDIGYGDAITPEAMTIEFPPLLDLPAPRLRAYPRETVIAEKIEAMVQLGLANTRMKDFYDVFILSKMFEYEGPLLGRALQATFERRGTPLPTGLPIALTPAFTQDPTKNTQWAAFIRRSNAPEVGTLTDVVAAVARFVERPLAAATGSMSPPLRWSPNGPWT